MAKATHIDTKYGLSGVWRDAYNHVASTLGGDGYAYYDIDVKKLSNPNESRAKIYLNLVVYVPKHHRHRAS